MIGPTIGGWLIGNTSWRVIFLINIPIALVTLLLVLRLGGIRQSRRQDLRVDLPGAVLCTAGLGLLVAGFIEQPSLGWSDPLVPGGIAGGAALLGLFVLYELRTPMPMLPLRLFRLRNFSMTNVETLAVYGALSGLGVFLTLFLEEFGGYTAFKAGVATAADHRRDVLPLAANGEVGDAARAPAVHVPRSADRGRLGAGLYPLPGRTRTTGSTSSPPSSFSRSGCR